MEKKKMTWADIERIYRAFQELKEALSKAQPYGVTMQAIELVEKAREEAGGALLFADVEEGGMLTEEARKKMQQEYLEKRLNKYHDYCNVCPNAYHCAHDNAFGFGSGASLQKNLCDSMYEAIMERLGLSDTLMNIAVVELTLNKLRGKK